MRIAGQDSGSCCPVCSCSRPQLAKLPKSLPLRDDAVIPDYARLPHQSQAQYSYSVEIPSHALAALSSCCELAEQATSSTDVNPYCQGRSEKGLACSRCAGSVTRIWLKRCREGIRSAKALKGEPREVQYPAEVLHEVERMSSPRSAKVQAGGGCCVGQAGVASHPPMLVSLENEAKEGVKVQGLCVCIELSSPRIGESRVLTWSRPGWQASRTV